MAPACTRRNIASPAAIVELIAERVDDVNAAPLERLARSIAAQIARGAPEALLKASEAQLATKEQNERASTAVAGGAFFLLGAIMLAGAFHMSRVRDEEKRDTPRL